MSLHAKVSGNWETITSAYVKVSGTWQSVNTVSAKVSGVWQTIFSSLSAAVDTTSVDGYGINPPETVTSTQVTCTASGGTSPYTYAWTHVSGDVITVDSPTAAATTFSFNFTGAGFQSKSSVYKCVVTDNATMTADSPNVSVYLETSP